MYGHGNFFILFLLLVFLGMLFNLIKGRQQKCCLMIKSIEIYKFRVIMFQTMKRYKRIWQNNETKSSFLVFDAS